MPVKSPLALAKGLFLFLMLGAVGPADARSKNSPVAQTLHDLVSSGSQVSVVLACNTDSQGVGIAGYNGNYLWSSNGGASHNTGVAASTASAGVAVSTEAVKMSGFDMEKWKRSVCADSLSSMEQWLLSQYGTQKNFSLIDRLSTDEFLASLKISTATVLSPDVRSALAQKFKATHIFFIRETIDEADGALYRKFTETRELRLLDAGTGAVLAAETGKYITRRPY